MSGAYKYRPQYTQNTIGPSPPEEQVNDESGLLREKLAKSLVEAWAKYLDAFAVSPHGSQKQMAALLELGPMHIIEARVAAAVRDAPPA